MATQKFLFGLLFSGAMIVPAFAQNSDEALVAPSPSQANKQFDQTLLVSPPNDSKTVSLSHGPEATAPMAALPLTTGHSEINGGFVFTHTYRGVSRSAYNGSVEYAYFLRDAFSVGGSFDIDYDGADTVSLAGVVGSYYFYQKDMQAARVVLALEKGLSAATIDGRARADLRYEFFFTNGLSFGPYVAFARVIRNSNAVDYNRLYLGARFGLYF